MSLVPTFAVAGDPNVGKSTVVATLAEDDAIRISRRAGTTSEATPYAAMIGEREILKFVDLPGFENTAYLRAWFEEHRHERGDLAARFVAEHADQADFKPECEILGSLTNKTVLFVVDATRHVEQKDRDQAEILRLCTDKRMAIVNIRSAENALDESILEEWRKMLGRSFTYEEFDPLKATFAARIKLLRKIAEVIPGWRERVLEAVDLFERDWHEKRLPLANNALLQLLSGALKIESSVSITRGEEAAKKEVKGKVEEKARELEEKFREEVRQIFHHHRTEWEKAEKGLLDDDLFDEKQWEMFGLNKTQLIWAGAVTGLVIGAGIDLMVGGLSFFLGAALGAATGAISTWLTAGNAIDIDLPGLKIPGLPFSIPLRVKSSERAVARLKPESNLSWVLLDRALLFIEASANWSHGRQDKPSPIDEKKMGVTSSWSNDQRKFIIQWIGSLRSEKVGSARLEGYEAAAWDFLLSEIKKIIGDR